MNRFFLSFLLVFCTSGCSLFLGPEEEAGADNAALQQIHEAVTQGDAHIMGSLSTIQGDQQRLLKDQKDMNDRLGKLETGQKELKDGFALVNLNDPNSRLNKLVDDLRSTPTRNVPRATAPITIADPPATADPDDPPSAPVVDASLSDIPVMYEKKILGKTTYQYGHGGRIIGGSWEGHTSQEEFLDSMQEEKEAHQRRQDEIRADAKEDRSERMLNDISAGVTAVQQSQDTILQQHQALQEKLLAVEDRVELYAADARTQWETFEREIKALAQERKAEVKIYTTATALPVGYYRHHCWNRWVVFTPGYIHIAPRG